MLWLYFLGWVVIFGAIGAAIGGHKGRQEAGFLWGALLGPLGWLVIAVGPDLRPKCDKCGGVVVAGASRCKNCGAEL